MKYRVEVLEQAGWIEWSEHSSLAKAQEELDHARQWCCDPSEARIVSIEED